MNELALIFHRLGIDTLDVLEAAGTKWNFMPFRPGLVGGHCIGVDPYYLTHKASEAGYFAEVILAGRRIYDGMGVFVAQECVRLMLAAGRPVSGAKVLVLGLAFMEYCSDVRNTRVLDIIDELKRFEVESLVCDPLADAALTRSEHGIELIGIDDVPAAQAVIAAVAHRIFFDLSLVKLGKAGREGVPFLDVKSSWSVSALTHAGFVPWRL